MGKSKKQSAPKAPKPQGEYFYEGDILRSQRIYDPKRNAYVSKTFMTPQEQAIRDQGTAFISDIMGKIPGIVNMSPESLAGYREAYAAPQRAALNESYNKALGAANTVGAATGMRNSVGFNRYLAGELERNRAQGLADIEASARQYEMNIPNQMLQPYVNAFNLMNAALGGEQARGQAALEPAFQGSQAASNFALQNFQNLLQSYQNQNQPGFFGKILGLG
ncbi:MAG TPA: hypothetical protein V6C99_12375 [Oculatellaceae cyanobacterium]